MKERVGAYVEVILAGRRGRFPGTMGPWSMVRWVRAGSFASACAGLAAAGHSLAGGSVGTFPILASLLLTFVAALALTGRERTFATILPAVALCQIALHLLLSQTAPGHHQHATSMPMAHSGPGCDHGLAILMPFGSTDLGMLMMHAAAVLVTSWWLRCGEAGLCALVRRLAWWALRAFVRLRPVPVHGLDRVLPVRRRAEAAYETVLLRHILIRRGPPGTPVALG